MVDMFFKLFFILEKGQTGKVIEEELSLEED